ncbi:sugar nucleotide-binding protein [Streptomyces sp. NPDC048623]|uniref:SDR family oxidoreductase n=1 Tax=Streptomyces sp. NPDC048623 TaxID=3155761 RepID=UPI003416EBEF
MTALIIGASGFLGTELVRQAISAGRLAAATFRSRPGKGTGVRWHRLDLRDADQIEAVLGAVRPNVVINASSGDADWAVTADGSIHLAAATARQRIRLVHVSTDAVFSGADVHYAETALPDPITPYGAAKAAAETAIRLLHSSAVVARTSLIIGDGASAHERIIHELAAGARTGTLFTDDVRCPIHVSDLAASLWELADSHTTGVFHLAGPDAISRYALGVLVARRDGLDPALLPAGLRAESGVPGALDVRLDCHTSRQQLATRIRGAREFLSERRDERTAP